MAEPLNSSTGSISNTSNETATVGFNEDVDEMSTCLSWDFSFSDKTFLAFILVFLACVILSSAANGFLLFLTVRFKHLLWQPQFLLLRNISACGIGLTFFTALVVLTSIVRKQTRIYGCWCIAQFCIIRCFVLTAQMTLTLMAVERYIFICHSIHYLRMIGTCNVHVSTGLIWLVSLAVSLHGGIVVSLHEGGFLEATSGFLCDDLTMREHITLSHRELMLLFVPPTVITNVCILSVCYCYGCMYCTALRVSMTLKRSNHRANRTVGFYFLMFLPQLLLALLFFILMISEKRKASSCVKIIALVTPLLLIIPSLVQAAFHLIRTPQIRRLIFSTRIEEEEMFHGIENHKQAERENTSASPAWVLPSISGETPVSGVANTASV